MRIVSQDERVKARRESAGPEPVSTLGYRYRNDDALYQGLPNDAPLYIIDVNGNKVGDRAPYFQIECNHWTNYDEQETYRLWKPRRHRFYCHRCTSWLQARPKPERKPTPKEPLF